MLDHCTGPGGNLPALASAIGLSGRLVAMDLSRAMVQEARQLPTAKILHRHSSGRRPSSLPYADAYFDVVVHYGAINQFGGDKRQAIDEMVRVTKAGGTIVILDEGIEPGKDTTWWVRLLMWRNALFASRPPLELLPRGMDPQVEWVLRGLFYQIIFRKPSG